MDFDLASGTAVLARTPGALRALLQGLGPEWTDATDGPDAWSPWAVVGHLIHADRTDWIPRAETILARGSDRRFPPFDRYGQFTVSAGKSLGALLDELAEVRAASLDTLASWRLSEAELALEGEHPEFGRVTLQQLLATWVAHDLGHLVQVSRTMARQYRDAVGPWAAYLSVMGR